MFAKGGRKETITAKKKHIPCNKGMIAAWWFIKNGLRTRLQDGKYAGRRFKQTTKEYPHAGFSTCSNVGRWAVEQGRRKLYLRVVGMLLGGRRRPGSAHTAAASKWRRPYRAGAWSERTACTADRDVLPRRRQTEKRCTSSLSPGGRDAAGSVTNDERERPPHSLSPSGRDAAGSVTNGERKRGHRSLV